MSDGKTSISKASSYTEIAEFWDTHDTSEYWDQTEPVHFDVDIQSQTYYYRIEAGLSEKLREAAKRHGVSAGTLLNLWVQEKLAQEPEPKRKPQAEQRVEEAEPAAEPTEERVVA